MLASENNFLDSDRVQGEVGEAELRKLLARKEEQIAKGTIQLQEAEKKIAELTEVNSSLRRRLSTN